MIFLFYNGAMSELVLLFLFLDSQSLASDKIVIVTSQLIIILRKI